MKKAPKGKKRQVYSSSEMTRYLGVLHEEHLHALKAIGEQFIDVHRKFDGIERKLDSHSEKLDSHTEMIGKLAEDVAIIKSDVEIIKTDLKQKVDRTEFAVLERRVARLEAKVR